MHQHIRALTVTCALLLASAASAQEWQSLFDGKTFNGWEDPSKKSPAGTAFVIEDGCLKATPHPVMDEDIFSTATFHNFELEFDWKISPRGNSGVKYRIQDRFYIVDDPAVPKFEDRANAAIRTRMQRPAKGQEYVVGFECQITDNAANPDARANGPKHQTAALYDMFAALKDVTKPIGEFNRTRIVVKDDHIEHWLNGEKVLEASLKAPEVKASVEKRWGTSSEIYRLLADQPRRSCPISLQNHGDAAWFKNIRIRKLD